MKRLCLCTHKTGYLCHIRPVTKAVPATVAEGAQATACLGYSLPESPIGAGRNLVTLAIKKHHQAYHKLDVL